MSSKSELACTYAALILADDDVALTADKLIAILKAAEVSDIEPYMPGMFASALTGRNIKDLLMNIGGGGAAPAAEAAAEVAPAAEEKKEAAKKVESEESDEDMGFDLFG